MLKVGIIACCKEPFFTFLVNNFPERLLFFLAMFTLDNERSVLPLLSVNNSEIQTGKMSEKETDFTVFSPFPRSGPLCHRFKF